MSAPAPAAAAAAGAGAAAAAASGGSSHVRRDALLNIEAAVQAQWEAARLFDAEAGDAKTRKLDDKFLATFPYPYMNGVLHLGHGFTLAKVDFECNYQRLKGKNVLFPFGYHCTGMPICAAADRLKREVAQYGNPPQFPQPAAPAAEEPEAAPAVEEKKDDAATPAGGAAAAAAAKKKGGKSKVAAKASTQSYQWNILREMGVPENEIHLFQDARHWCKHFPPIATKDLKKFGLSADFRRSFITTDINPYYDAFIRWHFNTLRKRERIAFGGRLSIFSPIDNQTCADHDRAEGEGVNLTEYALIKLKLQQPFPKTITDALSEKFANHTVILPAATLRPETMYGQTNCWVLPDGEYGIFEINDKEVFVCSPKSALNMAYQGLSPARGKVSQIGTVNGKDLLGCAVQAPYAKYDKLYCLPLTTIKMDKGTAIVTSVPSDAPDDYAALMDLKNKPLFREKFGITDEMVLPFDIVQIIETPGLGMQPAVDLCVAEKVASQNDRVKLELIKDKCYKEGFAKGIMRVGNHAGVKVSEAKPVIKAEMIAAGLAYPYAEPEKRVVSRSGNECVVALADQWYLKYGEESWQAQVRAHVESTLETYTPHTKRDFLGAVEWLHEWACSRSYGLGTKLPWDEQYVIESLSDSTIYMAYYTIAHLLQGSASGIETGVTAAYLTGSQAGLAGIAAEDMTDDVWNYVFLSKEYPDVPANTKVPAEKLAALRNAFEYWYPMDLRVSGKDLIPNHLTMSLYNHAAIWPDQPEQRWPRSMFTNGFMMIDGGKMSKSTGNFVTLAGAVGEYSADATRFALADAGDGLEDANFERKSANAAILKLTKEESWIKEMLDAPLRTGDLNFFDRVFLNELNACAVAADAAYSKLVFRDALKYSFHQLTNDRDNYRLALDTEKMHRDVLMAYVEKIAILLSPICPHFSQHIWHASGLDAKHNVQFVARASWPAVTAADIDPLLQRQITYLRESAATLRKSLLETLERFGKVPKPKAGEKPVQIEKWIKDIATAAAGGSLVAADVVKLVDSCTLYIAADYPEWQANVLRLVGATWEELNGRQAGVYPELKAVLAKLRASLPAGDKKLLENSTKFASTVLADLALRGAAALELTSPFNEQELLEQNWDFVLRDLGIARERITIRQGKDGPSAPAAPAAGAAFSAELQAQATEAIAAGKALPGRPMPYFFKASN